MKTMRHLVIFVLGLAVSLGRLAAQECPAVTRIQPTGTFSGTLDAASCVLNDGSWYTAYRLDLPVRGKIGIAFGGPADGLQFLLRDDSGARMDAGASVQRPLEAGSYRLLVNGNTAGTGGAFTVHTTFVAEPSMFCSGFPAIGRKQTISNTLGSYGCTAPDGTAYDAWSLTTYGAGTLTVNITSGDFTPNLVLRGSDGRALANSVGGILVAPVLGDSQYFIVVASSDNGGNYQLSTAFQNAPDDLCRATRTFTDSDTDTGAVSANSCYTTIAGSGDLEYYNYYSLTLAAAGVATIAVSSGDFTPTLYLLDEAGNPLAVDALGGGYDPSGKAHSYLRVPLTAGNYIVQMFSDVASGGAYDLQFGYKAGPGSPCTAAPVAPADLQTGALSSASCRTALGLSDLFTLTLPASGTLELDLGAIDFPAILAIRDSKDNLIVRSDEIDGVTAAHIAADLPAGVYSVVAAADSYAGAYRLASKFTAHDLAACSFTQAIDLNGGYIQRLNSGGCKGSNGQPVDYYGFTLSADSLVLAVVTSSEVDGYLTLLDSSGAVLRSDDNSYGGIDPLIVQYLPAGSYKLAVRDASAATGGLYEVDLRTVQGPRPAFCSAKNTLSLGAPITGNITYTGCPYGGQTFADLYQFTLTSDTNVELRLNSTDFDAYLVLLDAKGNVVDDDDDGGGNTNARIAAPLPAGTYYVVAKPYGDYLQHGAYTISAVSMDSTSLPK